MTDDLELEEVGTQKEPQTENIHTRIVRVMREVGSLEPDARNTHQKYDYISADKILQVVKASLARNGLTVLPAVEHFSVEAVSYGNNKTLFHANIDMTINIFDVDGNSLVVPWQGSGVDHSSPDKAYFKGVTSGHKYFLMKWLMVGVGNEDGEHQVMDSEFMGGPEALIAVQTYNKILAYEKELWPDEDKEEDLAKHASSGRVTDFESLTEKEAQSLVTLLEKRKEKQSKQEED